MTVRDEQPSTAEFYRQLPNATRVWLEDLRPDDVQEIKDALNFYRASRTNGKFMAWLLAGIITMLVGGAALGDQVIRIIAWFKR